MKNEEYVNHEVRIQLLEKIAEKIEVRFDKIDGRMDNMGSRMDTQFHWLLGSHFGLILVVLGFIGTIALHGMKLI